MPDIFQYFLIVFPVAADKVALVIGNQDYAHDKLRGLLYPEKDAADVAQALTNLNFKVRYRLTLLILSSYIFRWKPRNLN